MAGVAGLLLLTGCATPGAFQASAALNTQGLALWEQGRYPEASGVFKRCLEVEQNPACVHNIGMMIENSKYNDPDPEVRKAMWADGKTPRGRAVQSYLLAARYGQPESVVALKRLGREVPKADLMPPQQPHGSTGAAMSPEAMEGLGSLARVVGCMLAGGNNCATAIAPGHQQAWTQPRTEVQTQAPVQTGSRQPVYDPQATRQPVQQPSQPGCVMNTDCQHPASCVKAPGARTGTCGVEVNSAGMRAYERTGQVLTAWATTTAESVSVAIATEPPIGRVCA